jgi:hypothetical protein
LGVVTITTILLVAATLTPNLYATQQISERITFLPRAVQIGAFMILGYWTAVGLAKSGVLRRLQIRPLYRITRWALLVVIVFLPLSVIATNLAVVPDYRAYAQGWDARHAQILEAKAQGESNITVGTLAYYPEDNWGIERIATLERGTYNSCGVGFYGVDSITVLPNDES